MENLLTPTIFTLFLTKVKVAENCEAFSDHRLFSAVAVRPTITPHTVREREREDAGEEVNFREN